MDVIIPAGFEELQATGKEGVIREMVNGLAIAGHLPLENIEMLTKLIVDREQVGSTGIMNGVGVPHVKHASIGTQICAVGRSKKGVEFESLDGQPSYIFFMLLGPKSASAEHLERLAAISTLLREASTINALKEAESAEAMIEILSKV